jgi:subfamily B ATP-binding cassette protein MsbA
MQKLKDIIKKYFGHLVYFYSYLRYRIFITVALSFTVGILDGFGLAMFIPLLQLVSGEKSATQTELGGLSFIIEGFNFIGIPLTLLSVLVTIVVFFSAKGIAQFSNTYYSTVVRLFFIRKLRFDSINSFSRYTYKQFVQADAGRIQNTMSGEVGRVSQAYAAYFLTVNAWVMMSIYIAFAFITNWQFAVLVAIGGGLSNFLYKRIYKRTQDESSKISRGGHIFQSLLIQMVGFYKYLKATGFITEYGAKMKKSVLYIEQANKKIGFYTAILTSSREPLIIIVVALVILIQVNYLSTDIGGIILSLMFFYRSLTYVVATQNFWNNFLGSAGALVNLKEFLQELHRHQERNGKIEFSNFKKSIELKGVAFNYGETQVLQDLSLSIRKNKTLAFVGESGSGKTTLVNLLTGLFPVDRGNITIDGVRYRDLDIPTFQNRIGYITQDPVIFSDTIYNNVTKWAPKTPKNLEKFWFALNQAAIADFVRSLPDAEHSQLGNNGIQVSGGQKQRLSIARELFKEVDLLVMDEATSALDSETERAIQENIEALKGKYTILIVAHRLSTIKDADEIFVLQKGRLVASGTYESLVQSSPIFKRMTTLQEI